MPAVVETWHRFDICRIDDLGSAIFGAELEAIQMPGRRVRGSLAFAARDGIAFSSGLIDGNVLVRGAFSADAITLGVILRIGSGSRLWLNNVSKGSAGVLLPGEECDLLCRGNALYVAATLSAARLKQQFARHGLALDRNLLDRSGLHPAPLAASAVRWLSGQVAAIHDAKSTAEIDRPGIGSNFIEVIVSHYARAPLGRDETSHPGSRAQIVRAACKYIARHLDSPISIEALSQAASTSRRTLFRAFSELLDDTPRDYVRRLRLHRIRRDLVTHTEATVSSAAQSWGMGRDMGRLARDYRTLFGESPSATLALGRALQHDTPL
ncbi:AraC family transcriptional regulator [Bradyrhizobium sp. BRP56]|uniref:helix-turn-helix domain-containing protein n=1 Tax=Bradyrhizobium sp. BRP56 TaxID=2793819 RepID=UPI001CD7EFFD|nr:AraC family transcriptional regulator [Bradyrhizobium sp. BRP56]MCA1397639.1 helix-turn-helix transcriptional regulator [Bradyrhizobium sp. BRP56]